MTGHRMAWPGATRYTVAYRCFPEDAESLLDFGTWQDAQVVAYDLVTESRQRFGVSLGIRVVGQTYIVAPLDADGCCIARPTGGES